MGYWKWLWNRKDGMQTNNPVNLPCNSVSLEIICLSAFFEGGSHFPWLISQSSWILNGKKNKLVCLSKNVKTCWASKSQILYEEWSNWQVFQSPNLTRKNCLKLSHMHLYALYVPYVCCWCSGFSVAILLDWRVVGFSHCFSPVIWMVSQQQQRMESSSVQNPSKSFVTPIDWLVNRDCHDGQFLSLLNRVAYNPSIQLVNKDLGHCFKYCQLEVPLLEIWASLSLPETTPFKVWGLLGLHRLETTLHYITTVTTVCQHVNHPRPSWDVEPCLVFLFLGHLGIVLILSLATTV